MVHLSKTEDSRRKLLIVMDQLSTLDVLQRELNPYFEIKILHDTEGARSVAEEFGPDCLLTDLMIPRDQAIKMLAEIRNIPGLESIGVVLLTGRRKDQNLNAEYEDLVDLFIERPYLTEELTASLIGMARIHVRNQDRRRAT